MSETDGLRSVACAHAGRGSAETVLLKAAGR